MEIVELKISALTPDPTNARKHSLRNLDAIVGSLRRFGQQKPIVVDAGNVVRAGNATFEAARRLGWETVRAVRTGLNGVELAAFAVADNRTAELAEWDVNVLIDQLRAFESLDHELLDAAGYNDGELAALLNINADPTDPASEWKDMPEFQQEDVAYRTLRVHFVDQKGVDEFSKTIGQAIGDRTKFVWFPEVERDSVADLRIVAEGQQPAAPQAEGAA